MSEEINQDIKKWHKEISNLIKSKNVNNYEFTFAVPNGDTVHQFGCVMKDQKLAIASCIFVNTLFDYAFEANNKLKDNKHCFLASCNVEQWIGRIKDEVQQKIKKHVKRAKTGE